MFIQNGEWVIISRRRFNFLKSFKFRIFLIIIIAGMIPAMIISAGLLGTYSKNAVSELEGEMLVQASTMSSDLQQNRYFDTGDNTETDRQLVQLANSFSGRVMVIDANYKVLMDSYGVERGKTLISPCADSALREGTATYYDDEKKYIEASLAVYDSKGEKVLGAIIISSNADTLQQFVDTLSYKNLVLYLGCIILLILAALLLAALLVRPVDKISESLESMQEGFTKDVKIAGYNETDKLVDTLDAMFEKMRMLDESRQEFVSNVSHELKTPITSMKVLADSLLMQEDVPVEIYKEFMVDITEEIERENKIINDLLSLVKMDKANADLNVAPVSINELIELIFKRLRPIAAKRNIELVFESIRPVTAEVDEVKLTLAISNLVENAIKYNIDGGWVHVTLNADHKFFYVKVEDSGIGIPEESIGKIYERFYRVDKSHSREIGGTGLGLAITRNAILMHRGSIKVASKEDEGTTFTVRIPLIYVINS